MASNDTFVGIYDNAMTPQECADIIKYFNEMKKHNLVFDRQALKDGLAHQRDDESVFLTDTDAFYLDKTHPILQTVMDKLWDCYSDYTRKYSILRDSWKHGVIAMKVQKTKPGGGFHNWHYETNGKMNSGRFITFLVYLNTVAIAGETEFLYLHTRVNPVEGRIVIFPGSFTHTHRGNPPISGDKYVVTGWIEFLE